MDIDCKSDETLSGGPLKYRLNVLEGAVPGVWIQNEELLELCH